MFLICDKNTQRKFNKQEKNVLFYYNQRKVLILKERKFKKKVIIYPYSSNR